MDKAKTTNFDATIHRVDYIEEYRSTPIDHRSLLNDSGRETESLSGVWHFSIDPYNTFLRGRWWAEERTDGHGNPRPADYDWQRWQAVRVPSCWNMTSPEFLNYEGSAIYTRTFTYRARAAGASALPERLFLKVGAANYETFVFLNKRCLGFHRGGSTPFFLELHDLAEGENRLTLVVNNRRESDQVPTDNTDWFNYGGLHRDVDLIRLPSTFIKRWSLALVPGSKFRRIRASVEIEGPDQDVSLRIPGLAIDQTIKVKGG
ncbi:MAG TPA: glycoside hydrolase family 2, partial [Spirochaetia bacterium]|nr:glycoside hydrolase family 2 [Spirochaetia bacterium]